MKWGREWVIALGLLTIVGCGTTRVSDTSRTGTEQLLISHSVDQAISELDFSNLSGKKVFFDPQYLDGTVDKGYIVSSLRQHLLAHGCLLQEKREDAPYVVEARAGAVGTDRTDVLYGVPQLNVPTIVPGQPGGSIPEIPLAKRTNRAGVAKLAVFAYNRESGQPLWQSGVVMKSSTSKDAWVLGAGPFSAGTLHTGTKANGQVIQVPYDQAEPEAQRNTKLVSVTQPAVWQQAPPGVETVEAARPNQPAGRTDPNVLPAVNQQKD